MDVRIFTEEAFFQKGLQMLSDARRKKVEELKNPQAARLSLGAGVLLSMAMAQYPLSKQQREICYGAHGKPYLPNAAFHFSLSHSDAAALCAFGTEPIGADLQKIKPELPRHTARIVSEEEKDYLDGLPQEERTLAFYRLWAKKESLMKWDGRGLRLPMQKLSFVKAGQLTNEILFEGKRLFLREYTDFLPEYAISICSASADFSPTIKKILTIS